MDRQQFISYIQDPARLDEHSIEEIKSLSERFPYCQSLQILHLLNLHQTNQVLYNEFLSNTAAYISDRKKLKQLVEGLKTKNLEDRQTDLDKAFGKPEESVHPETSDQQRETSDQVPEQPVEPIQPTVIPSEDEGQPIQQDEEPEARSQEPEAPIVPVVEDDEEERLKRLKQIVETRLKQIALEKEELPEPEEPVLSKEELIDKFIKEEPSISRPKPEFFDPVKEAKSSQEDKPGLVTETLARIHIQQGNIDKAIEIYRKLSLNFPEKSSYFAAQIEKLSTEN